MICPVSPFKEALLKVYSLCKVNKKSQIKSSAFSGTLYGSKTLSNLPKPTNVCPVCHNREFQNSIDCKADFKSVGLSKVILGSLILFT